MTIILFTPKGEIHHDGGAAAIIRWTSRCRMASRKTKWTCTPASSDADQRPPVGCGPALVEGRHAEDRARSGRCVGLVAERLPCGHRPSATAADAAPATWPRADATPPPRARTDAAPSRPMRLPTDAAPVPRPAPADAAVADAIRPPRLPATDAPDRDPAPAADARTGGRATAPADADAGGCRRPAKETRGCTG